VVDCSEVELPVAWFHWKAWARGDFLMLLSVDGDVSRQTDGVARGSFLKDGKHAITKSVCGDVTTEVAATVLFFIFIFILHFC
jgi:hypothetical protein